jgi:beta-galactosidase
MIPQQHTKKFNLLRLSLIAALLLLQQLSYAQNSSAVRIVRNFDDNWSFIQQDAAGAEKADFDASKWKKLSVPHDWSIEGVYDKAHPTARGGGYLPAGIGWYRKSFSLDEAMAKQKIFIEFDGIMANSDVYINGFHLGKRPYGYISFNYDLTKHLNFGKGKTNVIAVSADNTVQPASRYYTGAGIYRHVRLVARDLVHVEDWGVYITTEDATTAKATVKVQTSVVNETSKATVITVETAVIGGDGKVVKNKQTKKKVEAGKKFK